MLIPKVKICGITNYEDAAAAMEMGADVLGFNFFRQSPRYVTPEAATKIKGSSFTGQALRCLGHLGQYDVILFLERGIGYPEVQASSPERIVDLASSV